jgi:hypothetical protein
MKILAVLFLLGYSTCFAQKVDELKIIETGVNGYLVKEFPNKSASDIFKAIRDWTQYNIHDAEFATNSTIKNEYLTFKVNDVGEIYYKKRKKAVWTLDLYVEVRIKEGRARIDIEILEIKAISKGQSNIPLSGSNTIILGLYKNNGDFVKPYTRTRNDINQILNVFAQDIFNSALGDKDYKKSDW